MKLKKNSLIILGLSTVALGTIGFSSWIIAGTNPEAGPSNVNVTVGDVEDHRIFLELPSQTDNILKFDADSDAEGKGTVVTATPDSQEDMTFTASFIIGGATQQDFDAVYKSKSVAVEFTSTDLSSLINSYCVQSPINLGAPVTIGELNTTIAAGTSEITSSESYTDTDQNKTPKYKITFAAATPTGENKDKYGVQVNIAFTFAWGSAFKYKNPVCLQSIDTTAKDALNALDQANNDFDLSVKISLVDRAQA